MKLALVLAAACAALGGALPATAQAGEETSPEAAAMEAWAKANAPGEPHAMLAKLAGDWDVATKMWTAPGAPPAESRARCSTKVILDGRFVQDDFTGDWGGAPFAGMGVTGYDNVRRKYVTIWLDSMTTGIFKAEGDYDPKARALSFSGTSFDPMAGKEIAVRMVTRFRDDGSHVFEYYAPGPDGQEMKSMEMTYTRRAEK